MRYLMVLLVLLSGLEGANLAKQTAMKNFIQEVNVTEIKKFMTGEYNSTEIKKFLTRLAEANLPKQTAMKNLIQEGNVTEIKNMLDSGFDVNQVITDFNRTGIYLAIEKNNLELVKLFVQYGANLNYEDEQYLNTPLNYAQSLVGDFSEIIHYLLKQKLDIEKNSDCICRAAASNDMYSLKKSLEMGIDINYRDKTGGETALIWAVASGQLAMVQFLLERGADIHALSQYDTNIIEIAESNHYDKITEYLKRNYPYLKKIANHVMISTPSLTPEELERFRQKQPFSRKEREQIALRMDYITAKLLRLRKPQRVWNDILRNQAQQAMKLAIVNETFLGVKLVENALKIAKAKIRYNRQKILLKFYSDLGSMYLWDAQYPEGIQYTQKAIQLCKTTVTNCPPRLIQSSYHYMGFAYHGLGDYEEAERYYKLALSLSNKPWTTVSTYSALADLYNHMEKYEESMVYSKKVLSMTQENLLFRNGTYMNLSWSFLKLKKYQEALTYAMLGTDQAKDVWGKNHENMSPYYEILGVIYTKQKAYDKALSYLKISLNLLESINDKPLAVATNYQLLAQTYLAMQKNQEAYGAIDKGFAIFNQARYHNFGQLNQFHKKTFSLQNKDFIDTLIEVSFDTQLGKEQTLNRWLNYKRSIFDIENSFKILYNKTTDKEVKQRIDELFEKQRKLARLTLNAPNNNEKIEHYNKNVKKIKEDISKEEIFLSKKILGLDTQIITYKNISNILKPKELYIDFSKVDDTYFYFILDKQEHITFNKFTKEDSQKIDKIIQKIREDIGKTPLRLVKIRYGKLYDLIIKKMNIQDKNSLIISPDGLLELIPFEAFYNEVDQKYLVEKLNIRYIPSGKELVKLYQNKAVSKSQKVVVFSEVNFDYKSKIKNKSRLRGNLLGMLEPNWHYLKSSEEETKIIQSTFEKNVITFLKDKATQENLFKVDAPKILHLSTHGIFLKNSEIVNPMEKSLILLSGANESIRQKKGDGVVSGLELAGLNLHGTELVVLSACETGVGEIEESEGISGLSKAFMKAGAKNIVMSLWSVDDKATSKLMEYFYQNIKNGDDYTIALNKAKRTMIQSQKKSEIYPYLWSGFIESGY